MTLILGYQDLGYTVLASDCRLTWPDGSLHDSDAVKMVLWNGRLILAYTGLAIIEGKDTSEWIAIAIKDHTTMPEMLEHLAAQLTAQNLPAKVANPLLIIVGQGWAIHPQTCELEAIVVTVWNQDDAGLTTPAFRTTFRFVEGNFFNDIGARLTDRRKLRLRRNIDSALKHKVSIWSIARLFEYAIRNHSQGDEETGPNLYVGPDVLMTLLSKRSVTQSLATGRAPIWSGGNVDEHAASVYVPVDRPGVQWRSPALVNNGTVLTNIMAGSNLPGGPTPEQRERAEREYEERQRQLAKDTNAADKQRGW